MGLLRAQALGADVSVYAADLTPVSGATRVGGAGSRSHPSLYVQANTPIDAPADEAPLDHLAQGESR